MFPEYEDGAASAADAQTAMLLLRASSLHMLRLQLAMERRDRAVALESVDELIALDSRMAALLESAPRDPLLRRLDDQKTALMREKFGLAAGLERRTTHPIEWPDQPTQSVAPVAPEPAAAPVEDELPFESQSVLLDERRARRPVLLVATILMVLLAMAAGGALLLGWPVQEVLETMFNQGGRR